jgi:signal transduction histidine kinase
MEHGSVICGACRGRQWMRVVWLACATVPTCAPLVAWGPAKAADLQPIAVVRSLPVAEVATNPPVRIRGVVTFRGSGHIVLQDDTAGIYVNFGFARDRGVWTGSIMPDAIQVGVEVEIDGLIDPGGFSPLVMPREVRVLGPKPLPQPRQTDAERFFSGADDSLLIEVSGVVHDVVEAGSHWRLYLESAGQPFLADITKSAIQDDPQQLVDAEVRLTGVPAATYNTRGEFLHPWVMVGRPEGFTVTSPPQQPPFECPEVAISSLARFRPEPFRGHRIRTKGVVIHTAPGQAVHLQDGAGGVRVATRSDERFKPGDRVEVAGFIDRRGRVAGLNDAIFRKIDSGPPPNPTAITPDEVVAINTKSVGSSVMASPGDYEGCLIRFPARLLEARVSHENGLLLLSAGKTSVVAVAELADFIGLRRLMPGSELEVTGIVATDWKFDSTQWPATIPDRMTVIVRSADDVRLIRSPSWWTPQRLAIAAGILAALAASATAWAVSLRREVRRQTAIAVEEEASRRAAALEYEVALRERSRIAADLHDTLLQTMTGIGYQLKFCTSGFEDGVPGEVVEHLGTAERLVSHAARQLRGTVWSLRSMPDVRQPLGDAVSALLRLLVEGRGVQVCVETSGESCGVHETVARQLLFVVQEAALNALHHGAAKAVTVTLSFSPGAAAVEMAVRDDGRGFDVGLQPGPALGHFGIQGMRERVESLDGEFEIASTPGSGTTVAARVPHPERLPADVWAKADTPEDGKRGDA